MEVVKRYVANTLQTCTLEIPERQDDTQKSGLVDYSELFAVYSLYFQKVCLTRWAFCVTFSGSP